MKIIFTGVVITLFSLNVFPQITFEKTFGTIDDDYGSAVLACNDETYIIAGTVDNILSGDPDVYLAKLDSHGDTIWTRPFVNEYCYDYAYDVIQCYDLGYVVTGYSNSNDTSMPFLLKYDQNGHFLWFKKYGQQVPDGNAYALVEKPDSGIVICGMRDYYNQRWYSRPFLLETSENGDYIWSEIYDNFPQYSMYDVYNMCLSAENEYILCGKFKNYDISYVYKAWLFKVNINNEVAWDRTYGYTDYTTYSRDVELTDDGGYILCGSIYHGDIILPGMNFDIYLVKTDNAGNEIWRKTIGSGDMAEHGICVGASDDGGYIIGSESDFGSNYDDIWLVKTDESGDTVWTRKYGGNYSEGISDICATPDGGYILCGYTKSYGIGGSDIYVIKTDYNGLLTSIHEKKDALSGVEVSPNPGNGIFHIRNCPDDLSYNIYNVNGKIVVMDKAVKGSDEIFDIRNLATGIYFLQLTSGTSGKSVKIIKNH